MRHDSIVIKSNAYGLTINLNPDLPFDQLLRDAAEKFSEAARFFRNAQMAVTFRGRELSAEQEIAMVDCITENAHMQIVCIVDENKENGDRFREAMEETIERGRSGAATFYKGSLEAGQTLETDRSVVILGDVNPGAKVVSRGSVIVLGCLMGQVTAGEGGVTDVFVAALTMLPNMLRIGPVAARSAITKRENTGDYPVSPKIAFLRDGHIVSQPIKSNVFQLIGSADVSADPAKE